ncbi:MAG TPA: hypothetical protein VKU61_05350 [Candidatus Binatia bacterium]|nr:hypothetical protein [Candidatus Binatia bacterium]
MSRVIRQREAWHSAKGPVHHNHPRCTKGGLIGPKNRRLGDGGKPLCAECQILNEIGD